MIVGVVGVGKARGVTTVATGLATAFSQTMGNAVVVEADPTGGDIVAWRGLKLDEGGVSLGSALTLYGSPVRGSGSPQTF